MKTYRAWVVVLATLAAVVGVGACSDLNTSPTHVVSLFVDTLPYPSIVQLDTLRDTNGKVAPMKATAYNLSGDSGFAIVQFFSLDANLLRITLNTNFAVAGDSAPSVVRVVAQAQTLQTQPFNVNIALRPDTLGTDSIPTVDTASGATGFTTSDTNQLIAGFCTGSPNSSPLVAWLRDNPGGGAAFLGVDNFIMKWKISSPSINLTGTTTDTSQIAYIIGPNLQPSIRDTTKGGGFSTRFLTFSGEAFKAVRVDTDTVSITVQAYATYKFNPATNAPNPIRDTVTVNIKFFNPSTCPSPAAAALSPARRRAR
jgi:hypothetical protein